MKHFPGCFRAASFKELALVCLLAASACLAQEEDPAIVVEGEVVKIDFGLAARQEDRAGSQAKGPMQSDGHSLPIERLILRVAEITGRNLTYEPAEILGQEAHLVGPREVKKGELLDFLRAMLIRSDLVCLDLGGGPDSILWVKSLRTARRGSLEEFAIFVPAEDLIARKDYWSTREGVPITTTAILEHIDARQTFTSLRTYFTELALENITPIDEGNALVMTSLAPSLVTMMEAIQRADVPGERRSEFRSFALTTAPVDEAAALVRGFLQQVTSPAAGPAAPEIVMVVPWKTAIVVYASKDHLDAIGELVKELDQ